MIEKQLKWLENKYKYIIADQPVNVDLPMM